MSREIDKAIEKSYETFVNLRSERMERANNNIKNGDLVLATLEVLGGIEHDLFVIATMLTVQSSESDGDDNE